MNPEDTTPPLGMPAGLEEAQRLAKELFGAYNSCGPNPWKTFDGRPVPQWDELGAQVQGKWIAVALAALSAQ